VIVKFKVFAAAAVLTTIFTSLLTFTSALASEQNCPIFNFTHLFIADYATGTHWDNSSGNLQITWSASAHTIYDETVVQPFTEKEIGWLRAAFRSWDDALDTVSFMEVAPTASPQIVIGFVKLNPSPVQPNAMGFWNTWTENGMRNRATIKLKASSTKWFGKSDQFIHSVQHELGNVLGLGDLTPTTAFVSVLEDPWQPPFGKVRLSNTDTAMVRQLYGESTCTSTFTSVLKTAKTNVLSHSTATSPEV